MTITIKKGRDERQAFTLIKETLLRYPGDAPVVIFSEAANRKYRADKSMYVTVCEPLQQELRQLDFM